MARTRSRAKAILMVLALTCMVGATALGGRAAWLRAKAVVAQYLIGNAWQQTLQGERRVKPWSWADTWPMYRLTTPDGRTLYVLAGLTGQAMAFGPATPIRGSRPGDIGTTIMAGHKDTVFQFLRTVKAGQTFAVQRADGQTFRYRVTSMHVVDSRKHAMPMQNRIDQLLLITCYPFGAGHWDSPLRYVVTAVRT